MIVSICICERGRSGHEPEVRGYVCSASALSVALGLPGVPTREVGKEEGGKRGVCGGGGKGSGSGTQPTHDACSETRESVGVGEDGSDSHNSLNVPFR